MIVNRQRQVSVSRHRVERLARRVAQAVGVAPRRLTVALVSDREMRALNQRFRGRPTPTDVLSFPAGHPRPRKPGNGYLGDIVIAMATARRQARRLGHALHTELAFLLVHGVLHLLGYDHETDEGQMNRREHALRRRLGLE